MSMQYISEFLAAPIVRRRPTPRLSTAIQRLGLPAASAAHIILTLRFPVPGEYGFAREIVRCAILQRHIALAIHPNASRDPSACGFGRFPAGRAA